MLQGEEQRFRVGDLDVDLQWQTVRRDGKELELPELSFRLLASLMRHAPNRATKDDLVSDAWDGLVVSDETLAQRVRLLRQALGDDSQNPRYIASVRGRGYRLVCPVNVYDETPTGAQHRPGWLVAAAIVGLAALAVWVGLPETDRGAPTSGAMPEPRNITLAVLPFNDLSPDGSQGYFADGMQEELLTRITRLEHLDVLSRTSVEQFRSRSQSIPEIGETLGARAIIEGSVRVAGDRVRITVQLIDAPNDRHVWAENYDRELSVANLFEIQEDVANRIATTLALEYASTSRADAAVLPTDDLDAYNAYLLGRHHTFRQTPDDLERAVQYLEQSVDLDPEFAEAWASLGWAYSFLGTNYGTRAPDEVYPLAREAALRALSLDGKLADARSLYADILTWYDWDFEAAEREYRKAAELDPLNVLGYALFLSINRRHPDALEYVSKRLEADPTDIYAQVNAAWRYLNAGRVVLAIKAAEQAAGHPDANAVLGLSLLAAGDIERAVEVFERDVSEQGRQPTQLANLAIGYLRAGRVDDGAAALIELEDIADSTYVSPAAVASVYFAAGDVDTGFALLQTAISERAREVIFMQVNQALEGYRDDPRYAALVEAVGFL